MSEEQPPETGQWSDAVAKALFPGTVIQLTPQQAHDSILALRTKEDEARDALRRILTLAASLMPEYHNGKCPTELELEATVRECLKIGQTVIR